MNPQELSKFTGKKVVISIIQADDTLEELTGTIEAASTAGVAFKEKGRSSLVLFTPDVIEEIQAEPDEIKKLRSKPLKPVTEDTVRQHLADRHGFLLSDLNKMPDANAFKVHQAIDHTDRGHHHAEPEVSSQEQAVASVTDGLIS